MTSLNQMLVNKPGPPGGISQEAVVGLVVSTFIIHEHVIWFRVSMEQFNCIIISFQSIREGESKLKNVVGFTVWTP